MIAACSFIAAKLGEQPELIIVDDGNKDEKINSVLQKIKAQVGVFQSINYQQNRGKGYALRQGVAAAKGDIIIYTDIDRDGILAGINWNSTLELAAAVSIPVIASGGLASMDDIRRMLEPDAAKLEGAISGRALYDGRIDPAEALTLIRDAKGSAA